MKKAHLRLQTMVGTFMMFLVTAALSSTRQVVAFHLPRSTSHVGHKKTKRSGLILVRDITTPFNVPQAQEVITANSDEQGVWDADLIGNHDDRLLELEEYSQFNSQQQAKSPTFKTWLRRLNTHQDALGLHKLSNLGYVISTTAIVAGGAAVGFESVPDFMEPLTYVLLVSTIGQCASAMRMAALYRRNEVENRDIFMIASIQGPQLPLIALWIAPFSPSFVGNHFCTFCIMVVYTLISMITTIYQMTLVPEVPEILKTKDQNNGGDLSQYWIAVLGTISAVVLAVPFQLWTLLLWGHDRQWFIDAALKDNLPFAPHVDLAWGYYAQVLTTFVIAYGSFLATLLDKKLIERNVALRFTYFFSALAIYASFRGLGYM